MIIVFDFEVFRYDVLLGCLVIDENKTTLWQSWDTDAIKDFYKSHSDDLWVGHNNDYYDNTIMNAVVKDKDVYSVSKQCISSSFRAKGELVPLVYDTMCCDFYSLKVTELCAGKRMHTSDVNFDIDRHLTEEEKRLEEEYNADDLYQTETNFGQLYDNMLLRLRLLNEFNIDKKYLTATEARLASMALHAKQIPGIEFRLVKPKLYDSLKIQNKEVLDFYMNEDFRKGKKLSFTVCGVEHKLGSGGIHAAIKKCHETDIIYLDVSGYYNLIMINYDLLPRTIPEEGKKLYEYMYHQQLALKGVDDAKRWVYKTILLSVFGASINKYTDFYDPEVGTLITITGQMFLVDLLEKLDGKVKLIQSNTDGIMVKPLPGYSDDDVLKIVNEWCNRTKFVIKPKKLHELYQRDVNNYCYTYEDVTKYRLKSIADMYHNVKVKGECVGAYDKPVELYTAFKLWTLKEPLIIDHIVVNYLIYKVKPEETIELCKNDLRYFQFIAKKNSFDYCTLDTRNLETNETNSVRINDNNRVFAKKFTDNTISMIYKHSDRNHRHSKVKMPCLPDNVFVYNDDIMHDNDIVYANIDFDYYIDRGYERIKEFVQIHQVKDVL